MDRTRRGPDGAERAPRPPERAPKRPPSAIESILELQATAGNRAVAASLDGATAQRQPAREPTNNGGALTVGSDEPIPLESATWSIRTGVKQVNLGHRRAPDLEPTNREIGDLVITRRSDGQSARLIELMQAEPEKASLRLERPSRDGALPATTLTLHEARIVEYSHGEGERPVDRFRIAVGDLQVAGMGKEAAAADAVATLTVGSGADAWPPVPVIAWHGQKRHEPTISGSAGFGKEPGTLRHSSAEPPDLTVKIAAGMAMTRFAEALDQHKRFDLHLTPKGSGKDLEMHEALVIGVASTGDGPNVIEVKFIAEG